MSPKLKSKWSEMVKQINLTDLANPDYVRQLFAQLKNSEDQYIVKDNGQPQAALLSLDDLELLKKAKILKERTWDGLFKNLEQVHAKNMQFSAEEVDADVDEAIKEVRRQH